MSAAAPPSDSEKTEGAKKAELTIDLKAPDFLSSSCGASDGTKIVAAKEILANMVIYKGSAKVSYRRGTEESSHNLLCALSKLPFSDISALMLEFGFFLYPLHTNDFKSAVSGMKEMYGVDEKLAKQLAFEPEHQFILAFTRNCFRNATSSLRLVFKMGSKFNHSCAPNCAWELDDTAKTLIVRSIRAIPAGEECTIDYSGVAGMTDMPMRVNIIRDSMGFVCTCKRCNLDRASASAASAAEKL